MTDRAGHEHTTARLSGYEYTAAGLPRRVPFAELPDVDLTFQPQWPTEDPDGIRSFSDRMKAGIRGI